LGGDTDTAYTWYVDDAVAANTRDYSTQIPSNAINAPHRVRLSACRGGQCSDVEKVVEVDPDELYPAKQLGIPIKGVCYDCGIQEDQSYGDYSSHRGISREQMELEIIDIVNRELACNGISIRGDDHVEIIEAAEIALRGDFDIIMVMPCYPSASLDSTISKTADLAGMAEILRQKSDKIVFMVGAELSQLATGIYPGKTRMERSSRINKLQYDENYQKQLVSFLKELTSACRKRFTGKLTYGAGSWEQWWLPWDELDVDAVGSNEYWYGQYTDESYVEGLKKLKRFGKPVFNTEFGLCSWDGSLDLGGMGWASPSSAKYDEGAQAKGIDKYLDLINKAGIEGCFYFSLIHPANTKEGEIRSYGLLRCLPSRLTRKLGFYMYKSYRRPP